MAATPANGDDESGDGRPTGYRSPPESHRRIVSSKVLDRETARVKFNSYWVISTELTNRKEILNDGRTDDDIAELDRRGDADQRAGAHVCNG